MVTVACVEWGDYQGRGAEYVAVLRDMVSRHLGQPHRFVCLTDAPSRHQVETITLTPGRQGWWNKIELFRPHLFEGRVLYLDLDNIVVGPLDALLEQPGIIYLTDWGWRKHCYGSGVMVWDAGDHVDAWERWTPNIAARLHGDQEWMTELGGWPALPAMLCRSLKYEGKDGPPPGAVVVCAHGKQKPADLAETHWSRRYWRRE